MQRLQGVYKISDEDLNALPVREIGPAVEFYTSVLRFSVVEQTETTAILQRDDARLGVVRQPDHQPGEAGSCAIGVADLDAMFAELSGRSLDLSAIRFDQWNGKRYRVFFLREAENGYCYCFCQLLEEMSG